MMITGKDRDPMKKMIIILLCLCLGITGCASSGTTQQEAWLETANLEADETPEELYEKAKSEGVLTVYSISTRMMDVAKSFEVQYPGLIVKVVDLPMDDLLSAVRNDIPTGSFDGDLVFCSDVDGFLSQEFVPNGLLYKYVPQDIEKHMLRQYDLPLLPISATAIILAYNAEFHAQSPISNWWEITEEKWKGKVYAPSPERIGAAFSLLCFMQEHQELLKQAYEQHYGSPFISENGESAFQVFWRRLVENDLKIVNSTDEVADAVGAPDVLEDRVGILSSSKIRLNDIGYRLGANYALECFPELVYTNDIMIAAGSKNINSAKLFIRWLMGETNGQGEGYRPYLQNGAWSTRADVQSESLYALNQSKLMVSNGAYAYVHRDEILKFWAELLTDK